MELPAMLKGESLERLALGAFAGFLATVGSGFTWGGWTLGSTAEDNATKRVNIALVQVYAPVCVERFEHQANVEVKWAELTKVDSWRRDDYIEESGFATPPGSTSPNARIAEACAEALSKIIATQTPAPSSARQSTAATRGGFSLSGRTSSGMLLVWRAMLVTSRERIEKLFNEGKTEQEVLAAKPLADLDAKWAANEQQAQNWTRMVYNSFSGRNHGALRRELETPAVLRLFRRFAGALAPKHNVALFLIPRSVACPCA